MTHSNANRHDGTLDGKLQGRPELVTVTLRTTRTFASTVGGQHLLWMLTNLLARQFGVIGTLRLSIPDVPLHDSVALHCGGNALRDSLLMLGHTLGRDQIAVEATSGDAPTDIVEVIIDNVEDGEWSGYGDGWRCATAPSGSIEGHIPTSHSPIGPYLAACFLAGEVFKSARELARERRRFEPTYFSAWTATTAANFAELQDGTESAIEVPLTYLAGAGAVLQAFAATISASTGIRGKFVVVDYDAIDKELTNLNRYCLALPADAEVPKVDLIARFLQKPRFDVFPANTSWEKYVAEGSSVWPDVRASEMDGYFNRIISAVDINDARHALQKVWPRLIYGASTLDMAVTVQRYDLRIGDECLMCSNPIQTWTIEGQAEALHSLSPEERRAAAIAAGADPDLVEEHLRNPKCGTLAEAEMHKFRGAGPDTQTWSVGFVSGAAGVLLAARFIHDLLDPSTEENAHRFSFERNVFRRSFHKPNPQCDCNNVGRPLHNRIWPGSAS
jgi:hypothetical protein